MIEKVIQVTPSGLYCPAGDFFIDPWLPVHRAVITHAHSDHARPGSNHYLCSAASAALLRARLGSEISMETLEYGQSIRIGSANVAFFPAGHVLGSAQVRIEVKGRVVVFTGDFKRQPDRTCASFEPIRCHGLITESTFALPVFRWQSDSTVMEEIHAWWHSNQLSGKTSILYAYALGKAQRLMALLDDTIGPIYHHGALTVPTEIYRQQGIKLPETRPVARADKDEPWHRALILSVPSAHGSPWLKKFGRISTAIASGWMRIRGMRRRRAIDRGLVISDHADWPALLQTIEESQAEEVWATHGYSDILVRYLQETGRRARALQTRYVGETVEQESEEQLYEESKAVSHENASLSADRKASRGGGQHGEVF